MEETMKKINLYAIVALILVIAVLMLVGCDPDSRSNTAAPAPPTPAPTPAPPASETPPAIPEPAYEDPIPPPAPPEPAPADNAPTQSESSVEAVSSFSIVGTWKSSGESGFGQAQPGAIVVFDGANCNFFSPMDTYAFYMEDGVYRLDLTSFLFADNLSFTVKIIDENQIEVNTGSSPTILKRVG